MAVPYQCTEAPMSQQPDSQYVRTHQYAAGAGRILQPNLYSMRVGDDEIITESEAVSPASHCFPEGEFVPPGFFERVHSDMFRLPACQIDWKYSMRREAQMILPFLYLGPWGCLKDRDWLAREGFTLLLAIRDKRLAHARLISGEKMAAEMGIEADAVDTLDNQELIATLPRAIRLINDHISTPANAQHMNSSRRKILLFCETGNGHSALVIIAYLMVMFNLGFPDALQVAHMQRFCIDMDESSKQMLASFESIIEAKRDVEHAKRISSINSKLAIPTKVNKKRDFEGQHDMTNTMDMDIDEGPFLGRRGVAPFQDRSK